WQDYSIVPMWSIAVGETYVLEGEVKVDSTRNAAGGQSAAYLWTANDTDTWILSSSYGTSNVVWTKFRTTLTITGADEGELRVGVFHFPSNIDDGTSYCRNLRLYREDATGYSNMTAGTSLYQIDETTSGSGATDSGWIDATYTDSGLSCFTQYVYRIRANDKVDNIGDYSPTDSAYPVEYYTCQYGSGAEGACLVDEAGDDDTCYYTGAGCPSETCYVSGYVSGNTCYYDNGGSFDRSNDCTSGGCTGISNADHPACTSGDMTDSNANCWTGTNCMWNATDACDADYDGWDYATDATYCSAGTAQCCTDESTRAEGVGCTTSGVTGTEYDRDTSSARCIDGSSSGCVTYYWAIGGETAASECCGDDVSENKTTRIADASMDNSYVTDSGDDACCTTADNCANNSVCYDDANVSTDVDGDSDNDFCNAGTWYDCDTDSECTGIYYCLLYDCIFNNIPTHTTPFINASSPLNRTYDNITCYNQSTADVDGDDVTNIYNWYKDGESIMVLNMPFNNNYTTDDNSTAGVNDYSPYNNNGRLGTDTANTQPIWQTGANCISEGCYKFDGEDQSIHMQTLTRISNSQNQFSVMAWAKMADYMDGSYPCIFGKWIPGAQREFVICYHDTNNVIYGQVLNETSDDTENFPSGYQPPLDTWFHVAVTYDGSYGRIYINGTIIGTTEAAGDYEHNPNTYVVIGNQEALTTDWNGSIDDVRVYNHTLSDEQIYQIWAETKDGLSDSATIVSDETTVGEVWKCGVVPSDGKQNGTALNSTTLTIQPNSIPTHTTPKIEATTSLNRSTDNITCSNQTTVDLDGDDVTNIYNWYKDGKPLILLNMPFDTLFNADDNTTDGVTDYSGYDNDGRLGNSTTGTQPVWNSACKVGGCYEFDGKDDFIEVLEDDLYTKDEFTIEAWVKANNINSGQIVRKNDEFLFRLEANGFLSSRVWNGSAWSNYTLSTLTYNVGEWTHIATTFDGNTIKYYINGTEDPVTEPFYGTKYDGNNPVYIGRGHIHAFLMNGSIDELRIYNISLTAEQIYQHYTETKDGYSDSATIVHTETIDGESWKCSVWPNDGYEDGSVLNSTTLNVSDSYIPTHTTPFINASSPYNKSSDNITCSNQTTVDLDGDDVTNIYNWYKDGESIMVLNMPFDTNVSSTDTGAVKDYSGLINNGTLGNGTAGTEPVWTDSGKIGGAYTFDGWDDVLEVDDMNSEISGTQGTIMAWAYPVGNGSNRYVFNSVGASTNRFYLQFTNSDFTVIRGDPIGSVIVLNDAPSNNWYHITMTWNETDLVGYLNGIQIGTDGYTNPSPACGNVVIGSQGYGKTFNGTIDEVQVYNISLSAEQIYQLYMDSKDGLSDNATIVSDETTVGDVWKCGVWPNDGTTDGTPLNSTTLAVINYVPTHTTPLINASSPYNKSSDNITCSNQTTVDLDGDDVTNIYNWYKDDKPLMVLNMPFDTLFNADDNTTAGVNDYSPYNNNGRLG
ncbi:MAG: LamG domain-containing protein, partial [Candidatus Peribacteraceae bacterium]|nr:LamG domain-containing protein [Candidatus Peribacteraceae bacterium]